MSPQREEVVSSDCCALAQRWGVSLEVLLRLVIAAIKFRARTGRKVLIISGFRTLAEQEALKQAGRPTAAPNLSTHMSFPATGIDVSFSGAPLSNASKALWGAEVIEAGLRWGGGSKLDSNGIPTDWQHVDVGPRQGS